KEGHPERDLTYEELPTRRELYERLGPRIAALPSSAARRVRSVHLREIAQLQARAGDRRRARVTAWEAWKLDPLSYAAFRGLAVVLLAGTPVWRGFRAIKRFVRRARGREGARFLDPPDLSW